MYGCSVTAEDEAILLQIDSQSYDLLINEPQRKQTEQLRAWIKKVPGLYANYSVNQIAQWEKIFQPVLEVPTGSVLLAEEQTSDSLYIVLQGSCQITKRLVTKNCYGRDLERTEVLFEIGVGEVFGERSYFGLLQNYGVVANRKLKLLKILNFVLKFRFSQCSKALRTISEQR